MPQTSTTVMTWSVMLSYGALPTTRSGWRSLGIPTRNSHLKKRYNSLKPRKVASVQLDTSWPVLIPLQLLQQAHTGVRRDHAFRANRTPVHNQMPPVTTVGNQAMAMVGRSVCDYALLITTPVLSAAYSTTTRVSAANHSGLLHPTPPTSVAMPLPCLKPSALWMICHTLPQCIL